MQSQTLCHTYMGKYPVVFVSLKGVDGLDFPTALGRLREIILEGAFRHQYLLDSDRISETDKLPLKLLLERRKEAPDLTSSLRLLCNLLEKHYGQKTVLLIDEYFGFTDQEVRDMLAAYGLQALEDQMREWYDGYLFGSQKVYCPWDVINYCYALSADPLAEPKAYWINTSGNDMVKRLISHGGDGTTQMEIERLNHGFLLALLSTCADWQVSSNSETGRGRSDILVWRKDRKLGFVVEVKNVKEEKELTWACQHAMAQIEGKDYTALLRRYRVKKIWTYAIAFWEKECQVLVKAQAESVPTRPR